MISWYQTQRYLLLILYGTKILQKSAFVGLSTEPKKILGPKSFWITRLLGHWVAWSLSC